MSSQVDTKIKLNFSDEAGNLWYEKDGRPVEVLLTQDEFESIRCLALAEYADEPLSGKEKTEKFVQQALSEMLKREKVIIDQKDTAK